MNKGTAFPLPVRNRREEADGETRRTEERLELAAKASDDAIRDGDMNRAAERIVALSNANSQMETFAYSVSHDLRAPVRSIRNFSEILQTDFTGQIPEEALEFIRRIQVAASKMDKLILDLLIYCRTSQEELEIGVVPLDPLLAEIMGKEQPLIDQRRARVTVESPLPSVLGHAVTLQQALENLAINALKFVPPNAPPVIRVFAERHGDKVRVCVADQGIGIDPQYHRRIFNIFERLHADSDYEGTGLGLAIVRKSMERMGGRVWVESELGQGARFWIELPAAPDTL